MGVLTEVSSSIFQWLWWGYQTGFCGSSDNLQTYSILIRTSLCMRVKSLQSCQTFCHPMDCNSQGFSIHGTLQARILEWVAMPSSRGSSWQRDQTHVSYVSCSGRWFFCLFVCLFVCLPLVWPGKPYEMVQEFSNANARITLNGKMSFKLLNRGCQTSNIYFSWQMLLCKWYETHS